MGKAWPALAIHVPGCDPLLQDLVLAELDDFQPTAIQEGDEGSPLRAFFAAAPARDAAARALAAAFGAHLFVEPIDVEDEDWAARSQARLTAITIGHITICPPWATPMGSDPGTVRGSDPGTTGTNRVVVIQPSMGFGTGHHATTRLMLKMLQDLPLETRTVLDIGCGSGVLAIAAVALDARSAAGIDIDPDALENARENAALNGVEGRVRFEEGDFRERSGRADVVLANLTGTLLERSADKLAGSVAAGGYLIVSGFMDVEESRVCASLGRFVDLEHLAREEEWLCAIYKSRQM